MNVHYFACFKQYVNGTTLYKSFCNLLDTQHRTHLKCYLKRLRVNTPQVIHPLLLMGFRCPCLYSYKRARWRLARVFLVHIWQLGRADPRRGLRSVHIFLHLVRLRSTATVPLTLSPGEDQSFLCSTSSQILGITKVLSLANLMGMKERLVVSNCMWRRRAGLLSVTMWTIGFNFPSPISTVLYCHFPKRHQALSAAQYLPWLWRL